jgi:hypothetical protein
MDVCVYRGRRAFPLMVEAVRGRAAAAAGEPLHHHQKGENGCGRWNPPLAMMSGNTLAPDP